LPTGRKLFIENISEPGSEAVQFVYGLLAAGWLDLIQQCSNPLVRDSGRKRRGSDFFELRMGRWAEGVN
jgi:hypothetical protein